MASDGDSHIISSIKTKEVGKRIKKDIVWYDDPRVLWAPEGAAFRILPSPAETIEEKLNAIMRLTCWFTVIAALLWRDARVLVLVPLVGAVEAFAYQDLRVRAAGVETFLDERGLDVRNGRLCAKPTSENPFMNVLLTDAPGRPAACKVDARISAQQDQLFLASATQQAEIDPYDVNGRAAARQFYTTASSSTPNDQAAYLRFLYGDMMRPGCKAGNGDQCYRNAPGVDARLAAA